MQHKIQTMIKTKEKISLDDIKLIDQEHLDLIIFKRESFDANEKYKFFLVSKKLTSFNGKPNYLIQLTDQTTFMLNLDL